MVDYMIDVLHHLSDFDFGPLAYDIHALFDALADFVDTAFSRSTVGMAHSAHRAARLAGTDLWNLFTSVPTSDSSFTNFRAALRVVLADLDTLTEATGLDRLGAAIFRDGSTRLAPGLIRQDALPFMVTEPVRNVGAGKLAFILSPAPLIGNQLVEVAQRLSVVRSTASGEAGEEELDFEPWTGNEPAMIWFFEACALPVAVVLSGDVHYAGSSVTEVTTTGPTGTRGRYIQFTSSAARNSDGKTRGLGQLDDLLYDDSGQTFFQQADWAMLLQAGSSSLTHLERLARSQVESALRRLTADLDLTEIPREVYERAANWWFSSRLTLDDAIETAQRALMATPNTIRTMMQEAAWQLYSAIEIIQEFSDDPMLKMFGDFLTAPAPMRAHLRQFYGDVGLDPHNGLTMRTSVLIDRRPDRLAAYPVISGRIAAGSTDREIAQAKYRRTVGHANVGFISCETRGDDVMRVLHELRWYPDDAPPRVFDPTTRTYADPVPRSDWFGTLHVAGYRGAAAPGAPGVRAGATP